jgi:hypothetical protein
MLWPASLTRGAAAFHGLDAGADQALDLLGGLGAAPGQAAHLAGHHGKAAPCSPARAASTAAFSARMLVWKAMPSITPMMSAIFARP